MSILSSTKTGIADRFICKEYLVNNGWQLLDEQDELRKTTSICYINKAYPNIGLRVLYRKEPEYPFQKDMEYDELSEEAKKFYDQHHGSFDNIYPHTDIELEDSSDNLLFYYVYVKAGVYINQDGELIEGDAWELYCTSHFVRVATLRKFLKSRKLI